MNHRKRIAQADQISTNALSAFEQAAAELERAAAMHKETEASLNQQISELSTLAADAKAAGNRASLNASKIREFFA